MKIYTIEDLCPYCHIKSTVGCIETNTIDKVCILQCDNCQKVWKLFRGTTERMIRIKENGPETFEEALLCPRCWRELTPDYTTWSIKCIDPTCGYSKRIPGLSREQEQVKLKYQELKVQMFSLAREGKEVPDILLDEYKDFKERYNEIKKYDKRPGPNREQIIPVPTN